MFNYSVRPADVRGRLKVSQDSKPLAVNIISTKPDQLLRLNFAQDVRLGAPITVEVAPGLRPAAGIQATTAPLVAWADVPDQSTLEVRRLTGALLDGQPVVTVNLSQPMTAANAQKALTVTPSVASSVEAQESDFALRGGFEMGRTYQVRLAAGARGLLGGTLRDVF